MLKDTDANRVNSLDSESVTYLRSVLLPLSANDVAISAIFPVTHLSVVSGGRADARLLC